MASDCWSPGHGPRNGVLFPIPAFFALWARHRRFVPLRAFFHYNSRCPSTSHHLLINPSAPPRHQVKRGRITFRLDPTHPRSSILKAPTASLVFSLPPFVFSVKYSPQFRIHPLQVQQKQHARSRWSSLYYTFPICQVLLSSHSALPTVQSGSKPRSFTPSHHRPQATNIRRLEAARASCLQHRPVSLHPTLLQRCRPQLPQRQTPRHGLLAVKHLHAPSGPLR